MIAARVSGYYDLSCIHRSWKPHFLEIAAGPTGDAHFERLESSSMPDRIIAVCRLPGGSSSLNALKGRRT
jgi:hypothetical protein